MRRNDPINLVQFCDEPQKYVQNIDTPNNIRFSENPQNIEIQNFEPPKMTRTYVWIYQTNPRQLRGTDTRQQ